MLASRNLKRKTPSLSLRLRIPLTRGIGIFVRHLFGVRSVVVRLLFDPCSALVWWCISVGG